ncbi:MAG: toll/interleukin-1 receptor domain-containing protein [Microscillaceae bacterium]|jgi:hypothetical protein|nr:toll/interleukin-1 receptor domain-containing protein [Microscillaceae bacterium]
MLNIDPIKDLIGKNKTKEAFQAIDKLLDIQLAGAKLKNFAASHDDNLQPIRDKKNEIKLLQGQLSEIEKNQRLGLTTDAEAMTQKSKITFGLLNILDELYNWYPDTTKPNSNIAKIQTTDDLLQWLYEEYQAEKPKDDELKFTFHQDFKGEVDSRRELRDLFRVLENQDYIQFRTVFGAYSVRLLNKFFKRFDKITDTQKPDNQLVAEKLDVFISYSTKNQKEKNELKEIFDNENITYFLDEFSLEIGKNIPESLNKGLRDSRFTVLLVSELSLKSIWVCLECDQRLKQEEFEGLTTFLPVLIDEAVFNNRFYLDLVKHFKALQAEFEGLRKEAVELGVSTKIYNDEIETIEKVLPRLSDILQKITKGLSANFADENRKQNDLQKLLATIKKGRTA